MHERVRDALLGAWGRAVATRYVTTLLVAVALAVGGVALTLTRLEFRADRSELVDPNLEWNRLYASYKSRFDRWDDLVVCFDGDPDDVRIDALARGVAADLRADPRVTAAEAGFDVTDTGPRFFAAAPPAEFDVALERLLDGRRIAAAPSANVALATALAQIQDRDGDMESLDLLELFLAPYIAALEGRAPDFSFLTGPPTKWQPFVSSAESARLRFVQVQFAGAGGGVDRVSDDLRALRRRVGEAVAASSLDVEWGVTGVPAIEADETAQSIRDSTVASIVAFVLITVLMLVVFRGIVVPLLAVGALLVGMAWSFGWLVLAVGHLQLLSVVFSVILLGLGVDFAVHLVARLELLRDEYEHLPDATARVFRGVGPGMITGAVTTAAAFGATALTKFKGMAEMGLIAGGGILLCLVAVLSVFPAGLAATRGWKRHVRHRPGGEGVHFAGGRLDAVDFHPRMVLGIAAVVLGLLAIPASMVRYDPNILNLQPPGIESVEWERRIVEADAGSVWAGVVQTTAEEAPSLVDRLRSLPEVSDVGAMGMLVRPDRGGRARRIAEVAARAVEPRSADPGSAGLRRQLALVQVGLRRRAAREAGAVAERLRALADEVRAGLTDFARRPAHEQDAAHAALDASYRAAHEVLRARLEQALTPTPLGPDDLPAVLRERWTDGAIWLLEVNPAADPAGRAILHPDRLGPFVEAVRAVAPTVHGPPVQIYESSELIKREYVKAAAYAIAAILVLLVLDFRSLTDALCAMLPVVLGFGGVFGLMGVVGVPLNFANIIVLPLIFGIGVDAGVHVVHRWRAEPYGRPAGLSGGTGRGITVTMLTTMIGFGCMLIARHRGIRSLGFVMVAGLGVTLLACYLVLPAVLRIRTRPWSEAGAVGTSPLPPTPAADPEHTASAPRTHG